MKHCDPIGRFFNIARQKPDHPAVDLGDRVVNYGELEATARRLAARFAAAGSPRVFIALRQGPDAYAAMIGAILSGGFYIPANVATPISKLRRLVALTQPNVIVADAALAGELAPMAPSALIVDPTQAASGERLEGNGTRNRAAYVIFTSGSTGQPKGVVIAMSALAHYVDWMMDCAMFRGDDRVSQFPSISFDLSVLDIFGALNAGATLAPALSQADRLFPAEFAQRLGVSVWVSVPSAIGLVMRAEQATPALLGSVRQFVFCGEALLPAHLAAIFQACPDALVMNLYGPTETTVSMTSLPLRAHDYAQACANSAALGEPIADMGLHLIGGAHAGEGEIVLTGPQLALEYWQDPERTAKAFRQVSIGGQTLRGYFTGDWAERIGRHVFFKGRIDTQMKINGHRIETGEIVARLAACGRPGACVVKHRESLTAVVEAVAAKAFAPEALRAQLSAELEPYAVPSYIYEIEQMPRNANGKLDEAAVRAWLEEKPRFVGRAPASAAPLATTQED